MKILIGTNNPSKIDYWNSMLPDIDMISPKDIKLVLDVKEGAPTVEENAERKAIAFAKAADMLAISDDRGLFIPALNNEPGVAVRTWGHTVPHMDDDDWFAFFKKKIEGVDDLAASFDTAVCIARPDGKFKTMTFHDKGHFDLGRVNNAYKRGFPLSNIFVRDGFNKTWSEMTTEEKSRYQEDVSEQVMAAIKELADD